MSDVADLFPEGTFTDDEPDEAEDSTTEQVVDEPEESGTDTETTDDEAPSEAPLIFGKYKTLEDAEKGHKELERQFHERQQAQPAEEAEEEEDQDPFGLWGTELGDGEAQQLAERLVRYPHDAREIVEYVQANQHLFGPAGQEVSEQMFALWNAQNPYAAQSWIADQRMAAYQEQIAEQQAPLQAHYTNQMASLAVHRATIGDDALPRFAEFKNQILESITKPEVTDYIRNHPEFAKDPEKMFGLLKAAWTNCIAQEYLSTAQHATTASGEPAPGTPAKAKPRTQQRSTAAAPAPDGVDDLFPAGTFRQG